MYSYHNDIKLIVYINNIEISTEIKKDPKKYYLINLQKSQM